jgi:hypothetical protein
MGRVCRVAVVAVANEEEISGGWIAAVCPSWSGQRSVTSSLDRARGVATGAASNAIG